MRRTWHRRFVAGLLFGALWAALVPGPAAAATSTQTWFTSTGGNPVPGWTLDFWVGITPAPDGGTVELRVDGETVYSRTLAPGAGSTLLHWVPTAIGTFDVQAYFLGTAAYAPSNSQVREVEIVLPTPYSVTVTADPNPVARNGQVTFSTTVVPNPGPGSIEWYRSDIGLMATTSLNANGVATWTTSFANAGTVAVTGKFTGNDAYSPRPSELYYLTVLGDGVNLALSVPSNPSPEGPITMTATLTPNPGGGTLRWALCSGCSPTEVPVNPNGPTAIPLGTLSTSYYPIQVEFLGHGNYAATSKTLELQVWSSTSTTVVSDRASAYQGELPVKLTASVGPQAGGGTVTFIDNVNGSIVSFGPYAINSSGVATFSSTALRLGTHTITARYNGAQWYLGSTSAPITVTILADMWVHASFAPNMSTFYPAVDGFKDKVRLGGTLQEKATVTIKVINSAGSTKRTWNLGTKNPGAYYVDWGGKTATGVKLPAGKYRVTASFTDLKGHKRTIVGYVNLSWRGVIWKNVTVTRYGEAGTYYVGLSGGAIYYSLVYPKGRILDSGEMIRGCEDCGFAAGQFKFQLVTYTTVLGYRYLYIETRGHGFSDREHTGNAGLVDPKTGNLALQHPLPLYDEVGVKWGIPFGTAYLNASKQVEAWIWMEQAWGDAWDVNYLRLTYQYAVWA